LLRGVAFLGLLLLASVDVAADPPRVDVLGDPLPERAKARLGTARGIGLSRDGTVLPPDFKSTAAVEPQKGIVIRDLETGRELKRLSLDKAGNISVIAVSADGKRLATWDYGLVTIWDISTSRPVLTFKPG